MGVILSLGTNCGNRRQNLNKVIKRLKNFFEVKRISSIYLSSAAFNSYNSDFFNITVLGETFLSPYYLLKEIKTLEFLMGRRTNYRFKQRIIDIDILVFENRIVNLPYLKIPHPEFIKRDFFLIPAIEISPLYVHPIEKKQIKDLSPQIKTILKKL